MRIDFRLIIFFVLLINSLNARVFAQGEILFKSGTDLSSSLINDVFQDNNGLVWISTEDGLNIYNGVSFFTIRHVDGDTTSLLNDYVRLVYQMRNGDIFVGTSSGLQYFDRCTQKFHNVHAFSNSGYYLSGVSISSICEVNDTLTLIGSSGYGLFSLIKLDQSRYEIRKVPFVLRAYVESIVKSTDGHIFVSYMDGGVARLDQALNMVDFVGFEPPENVLAITPDSTGHIFIGTTIGRVLLYDPNQENKYQEIVSTSQNFHSVYDFYVDDRGYVSFGTDGAGIKYLKPVHGGGWELHNMDLVSLDGRKLKVHSIMRDNSGNFWLGCFQRGILLRPSDNQVFEYIGPSSYSRNVIGDCCVSSVMMDSQDNLYVGTDNDGIYVIDSDCHVLHHYQRDNAQSLVPNAVLSICEDSHKRIWIGGYNSGLVYIDPASKVIRRFDLSVYDKSNPMPSVYDIVEDVQGGYLYVSASGEGVYRIDVNTMKVKLYNVHETSLLHDFSQDQINNTWINCLMISRNRKLYMGSYSGFGCMDIETESFVSTYGRNSYLEGVIIHALYEDDSQHVWIGTNNGLYDFDPSSRSFRHFGLDDGLPSLFISSITGDNDGNLWISSKGGISCYDRMSGNFVNFHETDGLYCQEFSQGAVTKSANGRIYFGSLNGVVDFKPFKGRPKKSALDIVLTNFVVNNTRVFMGMMSGRHQIIDTSLYEAREFHLDYFDNSFDVEFAAMQYGNPESLRFSYRMDGGPWIPIPRHRVSFSALEYGKHTFEAFVSDNVQNSKTISFTVYIDYPWYRSGWFYILVVIAVLLMLSVIGLVAYRRYLLKKKLEQVSRVKEQNDGRLEYFTNISHEIRTPMSLIVSPLAKLMNSDHDVERQRNYKIINVNAQRVLNLINQLMDLRKIDNAQLTLKFQKVDFVAFLRNIYESFEVHASQLGVDFGFDCAIDSLDLYIDPQNFDKVIVNILSNAFKFTPRGRSVTISLTQLDHQVEIVIKDNGTGMSDEDLLHIFDLFYQGDNSHRITMVGTGVGLYLTKHLVELHHGSITPYNNTDGTSGCSFRILLPMGRAHLQDSEILAPDVVPSNAGGQVADAGMMASAPVDDEFLKQYAKSKFRIMVVDDDEQMRKYIVSEISGFFHVTDFSSAEEAWGSVVKTKPDLIVSDIVMGEMSGITLCKKVKQNLEVNHVPVILLTAMAQDENRIKGLDVGADAFIAKPFNISVLIHTITNLLKKNISLKNRFMGRQEQSKKHDSDLKSPDERLLQRVMKVINENICNPNLTVETIAAQVGISRVHLHRKLKELTNQSTLDFLRNVRLNLAVKLLEEHKHSIVEVAQKVGFVSTTYFSTVFKDRFGLTPSAYMNQHSSGTIKPDSINKKT